MRIILLLLFISAFGACSDQSQKNAWISSFNNEENSLSDYYSEQSYLVNRAGKLIQGKTKIVQQHLQQFSAPHDLTIQCSVPVTGSGNLYEIGSFSDQGKTDFQFFIIRDSSDHRLLEMIVPDSDYKDAGKEITARRNEWMKLCNAHQVEALVNDLYTENALYYNFKPMITGRSQLAATYSYMNRPQYSLELNPICVEQVSDNLVFEIGQCSGSYGGQYVLVWLKEKDGQWRILLDANK